MCGEATCMSAEAAATAAGEQPSGDQNILQHKTSATAEAAGE
jgi:hypothetical protein